MVKTINHVFVEMASPLQDEIILNGGIKLYLAAEYNFEFNATTTGRVAGLPVIPKGELKEIPEQLSNGDEIVFSYQVVAKRKFKTDSERFVPTTEGNPYLKKWINSKGDVITVMAFKAAISYQWIGLVTTRTGERIDGTQGQEKDVERWLAQFAFGTGEQDFMFSNLFEVEDKDLWKVGYNEIFAKIVDGEIVALGDRVICTPIEIDGTDQVKIMNGIHLPAFSVVARLYDRATVVSGAEELGIRKGDVISFDGNYAEKYDILGKKYFIIKKKRIQGIWN